MVPATVVNPDAVTRTRLGPTAPNPVVAVRTGVIAVIAVLVADVTVIGIPSSVTSESMEKPVPLIVIGSPPLRRTWAGEMPVTVTVTGGCAGAAMAPGHGVPMLT